MLLDASVARHGDRKIVERLEERGVVFEQLRLRPSDISPEAWCDLFNFNINEPPGIGLYNAVCTCSKKYEAEFYISQIMDIIEMIGADPQPVPQAEHRPAAGGTGAGGRDAQGVDADVDDDVERVTTAQIKPRKSKPGGSEA